jgi:hypothetical protein
MLVIACSVLHHTTLLRTTLAGGTCILTHESPDTKCMGNSHFGFEAVVEKAMGDENVSF